MTSTVPLKVKPLAKKPLSWADVANSLYGKGVPEVQVIRAVKDTKL